MRKYSVFGTRRGEQSGELFRRRLYGPAPRLNEAHREARALFATGRYATVEIVDEDDKKVLHTMAGSPPWKAGAAR